MGFDISINCELHICRATGKLFYYGKKESTWGRIYDPPDIVVPKEYRCYLEQRGRVFHAYTDHFNSNDVFNVDVSTFLEQYPEWKEVAVWMEENSWSTDDWSEEEHNGFKATLEWCQKSFLPFRVNWSY